MGSEVTNEERMAKYRQIFDSFDDDKSGAVDQKEFAAMIEGLGMKVSESELAAMIKKADADGSGEIEFNEFVAVVQEAEKKASEAPPGSKDAVNLASIITRKANSGPPMAWRTDKQGPGITIDAADPKRMTRAAGSEGWGVQLLDAWLSSAGFDKGSVILELDTPVAAEVYIGVVSKNFNKADWNEELAKASHAAVARASDGKFFRKTAEATACRTSIIGTDKTNCRVQMEMNMKDQTMEVSVMSSDNVNLSTVFVEQLHPEVAVAIAIGPVGDMPVGCKVIGSSSEKTGRKARRTSTDLWDDDNKQSGSEGKVDEMTRNAQSMAM